MSTPILQITFFDTLTQTEVVVTNTGHSIVLKFPTGTPPSSKSTAREAPPPANSRIHSSSQRVSLSLLNPPVSMYTAPARSLHQTKISNQKISASSYLPPHLHVNTPSSLADALEAEQFVVHELHLHWGSKDRQGSEHRIAGRSFAGEAQIFAFNQRIYDNFTHAQAFAHGILAVSVFVQLAATTRQSFPQSASSASNKLVHTSANPQLDAIGRLLPRLRFKSESATMHKFYLFDFLPRDVSEYVMYDGSLTQPSCAESVTWIVLNRPVYISTDVVSRCCLLNAIV